MLTVKEAAEKLGVGETLVYGWCASGQLAHFRLGRGRRGAIRIEETDLAAFLASRKQGERQEPLPAPAKVLPLRLRYLQL